MSAGVTLMEVMVALAVFAILIGLATVTFSGLDREEELIRPGARIQTLALKARQTAIATGRPVVLEIRSDSLRSRDRVLRLPDEFELQIQLWGSDYWGRPGSYSWRFEPNGLCEPIGIRLIKNGAYHELNFHPLTAVAEKRLWIP